MAILNKLVVSSPSELKQCNYSVYQSALLTGFRTDFTSSVADSRQTSPSAKSDEKRMFSHGEDTAFDGETTIICAIY